MYISFQGSFELFFRYAKKNIELRDKYKILKDEKYILYKIKSTIESIFYAVRNPNVVIAILASVVHNFFILELLSSSGGDAASFEKYTKIGFYLAAASAAIVAFLKR
jgi:hypothetical protein